VLLGRLSMFVCGLGPWACLRSHLI
jgi:hypothetical protein